MAGRQHQELVAMGIEERVGAHEERVGVAVVAALELDDLRTPGEAAGQPDRRHHRLGARGHQAQPPHRGDPRHDLLGQQHLALGGGAEGGAAVQRGARAKLATNLILGLNRTALAEGLLFAETLGLDGGRMLELLRRSPAYSRAVDVAGPRMVAGDFSPVSRLAQHRKDLKVAGGALD